MLYDKDIRDELFDYLEERFGKTRIFEEKVMGKARADVIMVRPQEIVGLEIKSDADTYERLKKQVRYYNQYCDRNYIVIGSRHAKHVEDHVPKFWGILVVEKNMGKVLITEVRLASDNPKRKQEYQMRWLWKAELHHILDQNHLPKYREKSKKFIREKLLLKMKWEDLKPQICEELFQRDYSIYEESEE